MARHVWSICEMEGVPAGFLVPGAILFAKYCPGEI